MRNKLLLKIFFGSLGIDIVLGSFCRNFNLLLSSIALFILYFLYINWVLRKCTNELTPWHILIVVLLGRCVLDIPFRIFSYVDMFFTLPDTIFHLLGIIIGYLFYSSKKLLRIVLILFSISICSFLGFVGYDYWFHKINYGTYSGKIETIKMEQILFNDSSEEVRLSDFKGSYFVLDCWHTYCGSCYRDLPGVQQLYNDYKENDKVKVYALHCWFPEDRDTLENAHRGKQILKEKGYSIPCLSLPIKSELLIKMDIQVYPTILIFDPESNLIFRGGLQNASIYLKKLMK